MINSDSERIKNKALEIKGESSDLYEIVFSLAEWVHTHINYNDLLGNDVKEAEWVLRYRQGTCDEFTILFIALCRSLGIPAKYISGIAYSNIHNRFDMHAWATVYFPGVGWVPFDPTYGQFGYVDSSHIVLKESVDAETKSVRLEWKGRGVELSASQPEVEASLAECGDKREFQVELSADVQHKRTGFGSYNLVKVVAKNKMPFYVSEKISLAKPKEVKLLDPQVRHILLKPNEERTIYWRVKLDSDLDPDAVYSFPLIVKSLLSSSKTEFSSSATGPFYKLSEINKIVPEEYLSKDKEATFECISEKESLVVGESVLVSCTLKNNNPFSLSNLKICFGTECKLADIPSGGERTFAYLFTSDFPGRKELTITAKNQLLSTKEVLSFDVLDEPKVEIRNLFYPSEVNYDSQFSISFTIKKASFRSPSDVKVILKQNKFQKEWAIGKLERDKEMKISLKGSDLDPGTNQMVLTISYDGKVTSAQFTISLKGLTFFQKFLLTLRKIFGWAVK